MLEKWRNKLNKEKFIGVMFMKLLKVFDSINQILLVAKLEKPMLFQEFFYTL